jgi:Rod binding domain-containing protein
MNTIAATAEQVGSGHSVTPQPRLVRAAHEFEAQMMKELLKPMTSGSMLTGEDDDSSSGSGGALGEFASESLARGLSDHGGFGVAKRIVQELSHAGSVSETPGVTGKVHGDTVIKGTQ